MFKKHNCPFAIYVTTDFPVKKELLWHYHLQDVLLKNTILKINGEEYDCSDLEKKDQTFRAIREKLFTNDSEKTLDALTQLFIDNANVVMYDVKALSWEQIAELATDPLCTIGAHTVSHPALTVLNDEEIRKELSEGKKIIEEKIKKPVHHFAYPFGKWDNRVASLAMEQYKTAVLASGGLVRRGDALDRLNRSDLDEK